MTATYSPIAVVRMFAFVREAGQNLGQRVEAIQKWCGGKAGDSYCCYLVTLVLDICFQGNSPIPREGSCQVVYDLCKQKGWLTDKPSVGDLFFYVDENGHAHHIGFVTAIAPLEGIAGNTSPDGKSSNGTGVFEHGIVATHFAHYPR
jgi:hypothetical protein